MRNQHKGPQEWGVMHLKNKAAKLQASQSSKARYRMAEKQGEQACQDTRDITRISVEYLQFTPDTRRSPRKF